MTDEQSDLTFLELNRVLLAEDNPRHEPVRTQAEVIAYLCDDEQVLPLARDIVAHGLNPLELFAAVPSGENMYIVAEGNRRLCALKLLNDPDLAPGDVRREFEELSGKWQPQDTIPAIMFDSRDDVRLWLDRTHAGTAGGRGRRPWTAEQKARHSGYDKNLAAQKVLDAGQDLGLIDAAQRKGRISTVERYLKNPKFREVMGLDISDAGNPLTTLSESDFRTVLGKFLEDVVNRAVTTRDNAPQIVNYAEGIEQSDLISDSDVPAHSIVPTSEGPPTSGKQKPKRPRTWKRIARSEDLTAALTAIPSYKLEKLYYSLCSLALSTHTPLLMVGTWTLLESLTALDGRKSTQSFSAYLSANRLASLGLGNKTETRGLRDAIDRVADLGNVTKHDAIAAAFNGEMLSNDMETMKKMLIALARQAKGKGE